MSKCSVVDYAHTSPPSCCLWINKNPKRDAISEDLCTQPIFTEPKIGFIES